MEPADRARYVSVRVTLLARDGVGLRLRQFRLLGTREHRERTSIADHIGIPNLRAGVNAGQLFGSFAMPGSIRCLECVENQRCNHDSSPGGEACMAVVQQDRCRSSAMPRTLVVP